MKIAILSTSATMGGAAIAASRLAEALAQLGHSVELVTFTGSRLLTFLPERLEILSRNGLSRADLFKVSTARFGQSLHSHPAVAGADVVILGWINQGLLSLAEIARLQKPLLWVMHDMWCFTGICHHSLGCEHYRGECGCCRFIHGPWRGKGDLSHSGWLRKRRLYQSTPVSFVAVSRWLAHRARSSSLLAHSPVAVIPNPYPIHMHSPHAGTDSIIALCAARLDDPIKGLDLAIDALNRLADDGVTATVELAGDIRHPAALSRLRLPWRHLGRLNQFEMGALYSRASVVLSSSHYETLGNTLVEGMAAGCVPVSFNQGGQTDIIDHLHTGYLAKYPDTADLARGLRWALKAPLAPEQLHQAALARFGYEQVARQYIQLIHDTLHVSD